MTTQQTRAEKALQLALAGATVLTANTRSARTLRLEAESRAFNTRTVCQTPDILPLSAWLSRTWTECLLRNTTHRALLQPQVASALWERVIAASSPARHLLSHAAAAREAQQAWGLIHDYTLGLSRSQFSATTESLAFFEWVVTYKEECRKKGWIDASAALAALASHPEWLGGTARTLAAFGFDAFTPLQQELWSALRTAGTEVVLLTPEVDSFPGTARTAAFTDSSSELRVAAEWARKKLDLNPRAHIGVLVPALSQQRNHIDTIFAECLHPQTLLLTGTRPQRSYDISLGRPLSEHPMIRTAFQFAALVLSGLPARDVSVLLRSRYIGGGTSEQNERALLDVELRKQLRSGITVSQLLKSEAQLARTPKFYRILAASKKIEAQSPRRMTRGAFATEIRRLLFLAGWPGDGVQEFALNTEEFQVSDAWDGLLSDFGALDQVLPTREPAELLRELERAARNEIFALENVAAPIQIVGPNAASGEHFDAIWMCGLSDEAWPQRSHPNPFIPWAMQQESQLPGASPELDLQRARRVTGRVLQSAPESIFSWPQREEDRQLRPSSLLSGIPGVGSNALPEAGASLWSSLQKSSGLETGLDAMAPPVKDADLATHSTKLIEWQSACPFSAYAIARLAAAKLDQPALGADPRDRGLVTELALQYVWQAFRSLSDLQTLTSAQIEEGISSAVTRALNEKFPQSDDPWMPAHRELERNRLEALLREWLDVERTRSNFTNVQSQVEINLQLGEVSIKGRADRIDQIDDKYAVIDYKTGGTKYTTSSWTPPRPRDPQLPLYAVALQREGRELAGVAFARLRTGSCSFSDEALDKSIFGVKNNRKRYGQFAETLASWGSEIDQLAAAFASGHAEVDPKHPPQHNQSSCQRCHLHSLCRVAELAPPPMEEEEYGNGE